MWTGPNGNSYTGLNFSVSFATASTNRDDLKTVTLNWGDTQSWRAVVYELTPVMHAREQFPGRDQDRFGVGEVVELSFKASPPVSAAEAGAPRWMIAEGYSPLMENADDGFASFSAVGNATLRLVVTRGALKGMSLEGSVVNVGGPAEFANISYLDTNGPMSREAIQIMGFRKGKDLINLKKFADALETAFTPGNSERYFGLITAVLYELANFDLDLDQQFELERQLLNRALAKTNSLPLIFEIGYLIQSRTELLKQRETMEPKAWAQRRTVETERWLRALQRAHAAVDWAYDAAQEPMVNDSSAFFSNDPIELEKYRANKRALEEQNARRARKQEEQRNLKWQYESFTPSAKRFLVSIYSEAPLATDELQGFLENYVADKPLRKSIRDELSERLSRTDYRK